MRNGGGVGWDKANACTGALVSIFFLAPIGHSFLSIAFSSICSVSSFLSPFTKKSSVFKNNNQLKQQRNAFFLIQRHPLFDILFLSLSRKISYKGGMCILHLFLLFSKRKSGFCLHHLSDVAVLMAIIYLPSDICMAPIHLLDFDAFNSIVTPTLKSSPPLTSGAM